MVCRWPVAQNHDVSIHVSLGGERRGQNRSHENDLMLCASFQKALDETFSWYLGSIPISQYRNSMEVSLSA
jgi:hypothetical protein